MNTQAKAQNTKHAPNPRPVSNRVRIADREPPTLADAAQDALAVFQQYAKDRPDVVAFTCLGVGFVLGWKLKPWLQVSNSADSISQTESEISVQNPPSFFLARPQRKSAEALQNDWATET
jgi:hypothetical protein